MAATRVYILAKELGVKSSAIVKKCQDEELDVVKNHMSSISAGLAATIREWFSEGEHSTTVETTEKVDLKKVRIKKKIKRKAPAKKKKAKKEAQAPVPQAEQTEIAPQPKEPEPIIPAGPMLEKPKPAKLSGPQVVRVEAPELEPRVYHRKKPKPRYDAPVTEPLMETAKDRLKIQDKPATDKKHGSKRQKDRTHGRRHDGSGHESARSFRFGSQRRQRDLEERRARLNAATGEGFRTRPLRKIEEKSYQTIVPVAKP